MRVNTPEPQALNVELKKIQRNTVSVRDKNGHQRKTWGIRIMKQSLGGRTVLARRQSCGLLQKARFSKDSQERKRVFFRHKAVVHYRVDLAEDEGGYRVGSTAGTQPTRRGPNTKTSQRQDDKMVCSEAHLRLIRWLLIGVNCHSSFHASILPLVLFQDLSDKESYLQ